MTTDQAEAIAGIVFEEYGYEVEVLREYLVPPLYVETTVAVVVSADAVRFIRQAAILAEVSAADVDAFRLDYLGLDRAVF